MMTNKVLIFMMKQIQVLLKASLMALFIRLLCECGGDDDDDKESLTFYDFANTSSSEKAPRRLCMSECWYFGIL